MTLRFPASLHGIPIRTVPRTFASPSSSSRRLCPLYRVHPASHPLAVFQRRAPSMEFFASFATSIRRVHHSATFQAAFVPPAAFPTLSTAYSSSNLASLFHPAATSEIPFQGISPVTSRPDSSPGRPLLSLAPSACQRVAPLTPARDTPPSGFWSDYRSVFADSAVTPCRRPIPS
jgi:hypothetical protein